ncbi:XrtA system polysaccharide chain length determinant [Rugamonas sp.]|uniref:XrtA system polysaccharide chain length determinant n=1 Tax=Rugamonas sp. TaxID=1926287 RepID=UPI0025D1C670|nr:XrtA system polysaccharide chain length determinant [Rugamonas sp.]
MTVFLTFLKAIGKYRWYAVAIAWVVAIAGWVVVYRMPNDYQASARVYVETQSILKPLMAGMTTTLDVEQQVSFMRRTLISRPNVERVLRMVDLDIKVKSPKDSEKLIDDLMAQIKMTGTDHDDIYTISYSNPNPVLGKNIVQALLTIFVEGSYGNKKQDSEKAVQFIDDQIKMYEEKLATGENALKEFKIRNMSMLPHGGTDYSAGYSELSDKLNQAKLELLESEQARNAIKRQISGEDMAPVTDATDAPQTSSDPELDSRISALQKQLDSLRLQYTDEYPDIVAAKHLIGQLEARKKELGKKARASDPGLNYSPMLQQMNVALSVEEARMASLKARVGEYGSRLARMRAQSNLAPEVEAQLAQLNRDYSVNKDNYEKLVSRRGAAKLSGDLSSATDMLSFRVVDPPTVPSQPAGPNRIRLYSMVFAGALLTGLGVTLLMSQIRPTFLSQTILRDVSGLPVLGSIDMYWTDPQVINRRRRLYAFGVALATLFTAYGGVVVWTVLRPA